MVKAVQFAYNGMMRDVAKSKHPAEFYWDAMNIRITADEKQSSLVLTNEQGNTLKVSFPAVTITTSTTTISYNAGKTKLIYQPWSDIATQISDGILTTYSATQVIVAITTTRDSLIVMTTDKSLPDDNGMDCIWEIPGVVSDANNTYSPNLLYVRNMSLSKEHPVQLLYNYENVDIQKIYWVDGQQQVRSLNIRHGNIEGNENLIDVALDSLDMVGTVSFSQPIITDIISGGNHTAGMIQYAYNLYRLNSSQTKFGPMSELIPLAKESGGGDVNEVVGATPIVQISNIDTSYDSIKVYAIKYTSYNQSPSVSLIADREISSSSITIYDDGNTISSLSTEEFAFLGSNPIIPEHIATKESRMFFFNVRQKSFVIPDEIDMRAYSYSSIAAGRKYKILDGEITISGDKPASGAGNEFIEHAYNSPQKWIINPTYDCINADYDVYKYQDDGQTLGGEGKYIKYEIVQKNSVQLSKDPSEYRFLKSNEIYRIAGRFYNKRGQRSLPRWIADFKTPEGNLEGNYNTLSVTLKDDFKTFINAYNFDSEDDKPVAFEVLIAQRTEADRMVICQGMLTTMMCNVVASSSSEVLSTQEKISKANSVLKYPDILARLFTTLPTLAPLKGVVNLESMDFLDSGDSDPLKNPLTEMQYDPTAKSAHSFQFTNMMQMWSPDVTFGNPSIPEGTTLKVLGAIKNTNNYAWLKEIDRVTLAAKAEGKIEGGIHPRGGGNNIPLSGPITNLLDRGLINDPNGADPDKRVSYNQWYREFDTFVKRNNDIKEYSLFGTPEIVERGQSSTVYNNDSRLEFKNNMYGLLTDSEDDFDDKGQVNRQVINVNAEAGRNITFVIGGTNSTLTDVTLFTDWSVLHANMGLSGDDDKSSIIAELRRPSQYQYVGGLYGGFDYEAKKRTNYAPIGPYEIINFDSISDQEIEIDSPGDTYVGYFNFQRIAPADNDTYAVGNVQYTELIKFPVETSIDLKNRNDISKSVWDSKFHPRYDEYHKYNRVYSQKADLITTTDLDYNQRLIEDFDTRIQATAIKIPNESIDSWTDILVNETLDLDGKYGPINGVVNFNDNIYTLQDEAVALISISPRVTVSGGDGIPTELGTGAVLSDYNYVTTKSGTINKWSIIETRSGFYYFDLYNRTWMSFRGNSLVDLFDTYGMNSFIRNNIAYNFVAMDNPILRKGVSTGYDLANSTVYLTLLQTGMDFTISFNERTNSFVSFHSYQPSFYVSKGSNMMTTNPSNNQIYSHFTDSSQYNYFYGQRYPWYITFEVNPQDADCVFNNIEYKAESYLNGVDSPVSFSHIHAWNEYQDTGSIELTTDHLQRKFRTWRIQIPRDKDNILDRMRGHWIKVKLSYEKDFNYEQVIHNMIIYYTSYP